MRNYLQIQRSSKSICYTIKKTKRQMKEHTICLINKHFLELKGTLKSVCSGAGKIDKL